MILLKNNKSYYEHLVLKTIFIVVLLHKYKNIYS